MKKKFNQGYAGRVETGKKVLLAAGSVDTSPVAERLAGLVEQQTQYAAALQAVDEAQARVTAAGAELGESSLAVDGALDRLIAALVTDGAAYREPLAAYGTSPSALKGAGQGEKAAVVTKFLAAVQRDGKRAPAVRKAAAAVAEAVATYEERRLGMAAEEETLGERRAARDLAGDRWDEAFARLKRSVKVAEDDGAAGLYAALFGRASKPTSPRARSAPKTTTAEAA